VGAPRLLPSVPQEVWEAALNRFLAGKQGTDGTGSASAASTNSVVATSTDAPSGHTSDAAAPAAGAAPAEAPGLVPHPACSVCTVCCGLLQDSATVMTGDPPPLRFPRAAPPPVRADKRQRLGADPEDGIQEGGAGAGAGTSLQAVVEDAVVPVEDDAPPTGGGAGAGDVNPAGLPAAPVDTHFEGVDLRTLALPRSTVAIVAFIRDKWVPCPPTRVPLCWCMHACMHAVSVMRYHLAHRSLPLLSVASVQGLRGHRGLHPCRPNAPVHAASRVPHEVWACVVVAMH
jgi:hypothetical protein